MPTLDDFFAHVLSTNPFTDNRVNGPSADEVDVDRIHQPAFERLVVLARETRDGKGGLGAVLWGEAGIGKSHLLARLSRWANNGKQACFVYLHNLQASPDNLPRSLLKSVISILTRGRIDHFAATPLYRLVMTFLAESVDFDYQTEFRWRSAAKAYGRLVDCLSADDDARAALVDRTIYYVLFHFLRSAYLAHQAQDDERRARLAVYWLSGDYVDADEAKLLGLRPGAHAENPVGLVDSQQIKQVLVALARMALSWNRPFLLCFDQVDNLDTPQAAALARFLEALIDSSANLLVVVAGIQASLLQWRGSKVIQDSAWDRLAQFEIPLQRIRVDEGRAIVQARLQRFLQPFVELDAVKQRVRQDALFPLGKRWAQDSLENKVEVRPRDVVSWAREGWYRQQELLRRVGGAHWLTHWHEEPVVVSTLVPLTADQIQEAIDRQVAVKLAEHKAQRLAEPHTLGPNAENLAGLVYALLEPCVRRGLCHPVVGVERAVWESGKARPAHDLTMRRLHAGDDNETRVGVTLVTTSSATSAAAALRRLVQDDDGPDQVLLITDQRQPLPLASKGREYLEELVARGEQRFRHIVVSFDEYAELDALLAIIGLARSGDLEVELSGGQVRLVSEDETIASHARQRRYEGAAILRELLGGRMPLVSQAAQS